MKKYIISVWCYVETCLTNQIINYVFSTDMEVLTVRYDYLPTFKLIVAGDIRIVVTKEATV